MFAIELKYPSVEEEIQVVKTTTNDEWPELEVLFSAEEILQVQHLVRRIPVADNVVNYAVNLVNSTRPGMESSPELVKQYLEWGAGPRAVQFLILGAKARAALLGSYMARLEDVQEVAVPVLTHRIITTFAAQAEGIGAKEIARRLVEETETNLQ